MSMGTLCRTIWQYSFVGLKKNFIFLFFKIVCMNFYPLVLCDPNLWRLQIDTFRPCYLDAFLSYLIYAKYVSIRSQSPEKHLDSLFENDLSSSFISIQFSFSLIVIVVMVINLWLRYLQNLLIYNDNLID